MKLLLFFGLLTFVVYAATRTFRYDGIIEDVEKQFKDEEENDR